MKFTKEQLLENLKAKLTANNQELAMSERTLKSNVERLYKRLEKADSEDELDAVSSEYFPDFDEINKNMRKEKSDFVNTWKKEHPDNKPTDEPTPKNEPNDEFTKKLLERLDALEKKDAENEANKLISQKRSELLAKFKEKGIKDDKWADAYLKKLNITKDSDIEQETTDALDFYNLSHSKHTTNTPGGAGGGSNEKVAAERWAGVNKLIGGGTKK